MATTTPETPRTAVAARLTRAGTDAAPVTRAARIAAGTHLGSATRREHRRAAH